MAPKMTHTFCCGGREGEGGSHEGGSCGGWMAGGGEGARSGSIGLAGGSCGARARTRGGVVHKRDIG